MMLLRSLKTRECALIWTGQTLSRIADFLYEVTLAWWVLPTTGSATAMVTVLIVAFAPMLRFRLLGGAAGGLWRQQLPAARRGIPTMPAPQP